MATSGIRMVVNVVAKEEKSFLEAAKKVVEESRKEPGCLMYEIFKSAENPAPNSFTILEHWASVEALVQHSNSAHVAEFGAKDLTTELVANKYVSVGL